MRVGAPAAAAYAQRAVSEDSDLLDVSGYDDPAMVNGAQCADTLEALEGG
jgi:hypothetical protein